MLMVAAALLAAFSSARASVTLIGDPEIGGSVKATFGAYPEVGFDTVEVLSGPEHGTPAAAFEGPRAFRNCPGWTDYGNDTSNYVLATGTRVTPRHALVFDLYMLGSDPSRPFSFDLYAFDSTRGGALDFSAHVAWFGSYSIITEPALLLQTGVGSPVPEPGAMIVWSLLGGVAIAAVWRGQKRV
jgi:hypothetical protein